MNAKYAVGSSLAVMLFACGGPPPPAKTVQIGAVLDRTAQLATPNTDPTLALAFDYVNAGLTAAKFKDLQFKYVYSDTQNDPAIAVAGAVALRDQIKGILSDATLVDINLNLTAYDADPANDLNVPILCSACGGPTINNPNVTDANPAMQEALRNTQKWNFRTTMNTNPSSLVLVNMAMERGTNGDVNGDGFFKIGIEALNDPFGLGQAIGIKNSAMARYPEPTKVRIEQVNQPALVDPSYDYTADLNTLTDGTPDGPPDILMETLNPQYATNFTRTYVTGGYNAKAPLFHGIAWLNPAVLSNLGSQADGQEVVGTVGWDGPSGEAFASAFTSATGASPAGRDSQLYDGAVMMMYGVIKAVITAGLEDPTQVTGAQVRDAMRTLNDPAGEVVSSRDDVAHVIDLIKQGKAINYTGASGPCDFDDNNNVKTLMGRYRVEGGKFVQVAKYDCVSNIATCPKLP